MKKIYRYSFFLLILLQASTSLQAQQSLTLWYTHPAEKWTDALPIGNGRIGAMIFGGVEEEHLQFNESTLWTGQLRMYARKGAYQYLDTIRHLLQQGKQPEAETIAEAHFMGMKSNELTYATQKQQWLQHLMSDSVWSEEKINDRDWKTIVLPTPDGWEKAGLEGVDGAVCFRNYFVLPEEMTGKDCYVSLGRIRDADITYINGKRIGASETATGRLYKIPAGLMHSGKNSISVLVLNWNDKGGLTGNKSDAKVFTLYEAKHPTVSVAFSKEWKCKIIDDNVPDYPKYQAEYQPFGDVWFTFPHRVVTGYKRSLNIEDAVSTVSYKAGDVWYKREYLASNPSQLLAMHFTASQPGKIWMQANINSIHPLSGVSKIDDHTIALSVQVKNGALYGKSFLYVSAVHGKINIQNNTIKVEGADEATFYLTAATNFINYKNVSGNPEEKCRMVLQASRKISFSEIKKEHEKEYGTLFNRFSISLGNNKESIPTDERIRQFSNTTDPGLVALYVQYARYLLISSSRPDSPEPANLQGLWNNLLTPPWGSKFTTNINLEMNYWPAEVLNLSDCAQPLFRMISDLSAEGKVAAREHYHANGWVLHHNTDIWRGTAPINASNHGIWVSGAAWLCHHLWEHFCFTQDTSFLRQYYPVMRSSVAFFSDFLVKDPKSGYLISSPSNSPEHGGLVAGPTMDHQIVRDVFKNCIQAAMILHEDEILIRQWQQTYHSILPNQIGKYHQLQEWKDDIDDVDDKHRHVSHLWGVFPGTDITWKDSVLMKAARQSLLYRGDGGTGWSIAWKVNLWARFKEGNHALAMMDSLLNPVETLSSGKEKGGVYNNLFDAHPPFQIDGNFGGSSGVAEMLLQSQDARIELLPALPDVWQQGNVKGLCARGGFVFNMKWDKGKLLNIEILSVAGKKCSIIYNGHIMDFPTQKGVQYQLDGSLLLRSKRKVSEK